MSDINDPVVQEKLKRVREKLGLAEPGTPVAAEQTDQEKVEETFAEAQASGTATKTDWSQFDLHPEIAHLYPMSEPRATKDGVKHIVMLDQFEFITAPYSKLGAMLNQYVNGPDQWGVGQVFSNGSGLGAILLVRKMPFALPAPKLLRNDAIMPPAADDAELQATEDAAVAWVKAEGATVADVDDEIVPVAPPDPARYGLAQSAAQDAVNALAGEDFGIIPDSVVEGTNAPKIAEEGEDAK
jgi:hypothetical protein